ncbi:hypothetical protein [Actinomadura fibrosa]|nr:hypothetical protein [Actinomadura fibrosa]
MFRDRPEFALELLRDLQGVDIPETTLVQVASNDFNDRPSSDLRPDTVVTLGPPHAPVHAIIVEIQQLKSDPKRTQLPRYAAALWLSLRSPVTVLCICPEARTAAWYAEPFTTSLPGYEFQAYVIGPEQVPPITEPDQATKNPDLAILAMLTHGRRREVTEACLFGFNSLRDGYASKYIEHAFRTAEPTVQDIMKEIMTMPTWTATTPLGREERARGQAEGEAKGKAEAVLRVLNTRGVHVPSDVRSRITACTDQTQLDTLLDRALTATTTDDLFD